MRPRPRPSDCELFGGHEWIFQWRMPVRERAAPVIREVPDRPTPVPSWNIYRCFRCMVEKHEAVGFIPLTAPRRNQVL